MKNFALAILFALVPSLCFGQGDMTVGDLIKQLQQFDPKAPVVCFTDAVAIHVDDSGERVIESVSVQNGKVVVVPEIPGMRDGCPTVIDTGAPIHATPSAASWISHIFHSFPEKQNE